MLELLDRDVNGKDNFV